MFEMQIFSFQQVRFFNWDGNILKCFYKFKFGEQDNR